MAPQNSISWMHNIKTDVFLHNFLNDVWGDFFASTKVKVKTLTKQEEPFFISEELCIKSGQFGAIIVKDHKKVCSHRPIDTTAISQKLFSLITFIYGGLS